MNPRINLGSHSPTLTHRVVNPFRIRRKEYKQQYASIYYRRLLAMRPRVLAALSAAHPSLTVLDSCRGLVAGTRCAVVGTVIKEMKLKHTILKQYTDERWVPPPPPKVCVVCVCVCLCVCMCLGW